MIIDCHAHMGVDRVFDEVRNEAEVLSAMNKSGIDISIVQGMFGWAEPDDIIAFHNRLYRFVQQNERRIFGVITMTPYLKEKTYYDEAKRCVQELGFVGLKMHPAAEGVNPAGKVGQFVWEVCSDLKIPIMVHTGSGIPFSLPSMCIARAKQFRDVPCILAHSGMIALAGEAFFAADECENIYLDTSWSASHHIKHMVEKYGPQRVMFAGDEASNVAIEIAKYRSVDLTEDEWKWCMGGTANKVFRLGLDI